MDFTLPPMIGTALNVAGILIGGVVGLVRRKPLSSVNESFFKVALGVFKVFYGLRLTWLSVNGTFLQILRQLLIAVLALMLGKLTGRLLRLQHMSNQLGRQAREHIAARKPRDPGQLSAGFQRCATLFCAAPTLPKATNGAWISTSRNFLIVHLDASLKTQVLNGAGFELAQGVESIILIGE